MFGSFGQQPAFGAQPGQQQPAFGAPTTTFGAAPAFGAPAQQQPTGFGAAAAAPATNSFGFGVNTSFGAAAARPAFGQAQSATTAAPGGSLFGQPQQQPAQSGFGFGQPQQQQSTGLFGTPAQPATGFGTPATTSFGFGAAAPATTPSFGAPGQTTPTNNFGTGNPQYVITQERESAGTSSLSAGTMSNFLAITAMPNYKNWSYEELRVQDYAMGKKFSTQGPGMGATNAFGAPAATGFGGGAFGAAAAPTGGLFGQTQPAQQNTGFGFGAAASQPATGGMFGATNTTTPSIFGGTGTTTGAFGAPAAAPAFGQAAPASTGFSFGAANQTAPKTGFGAFGSTSTTPSAFGQGTTNAFGAAPATNAFGQPQQQTTGAFGAPAGGTSLFGQKPAGASPFGAATSTLGGGFGSALGANNTTGAFGAPAGAATTNAFGARPATTSPFGAPATGTSLFGSTQPATQTNPFGAAAPATGGLFGSAAPATGGFGTSLGGGFGAAKPATTGLFGAAPAATPAFGGFGQTAPAATTGGLFGGFGASTTPAPANTGFGTSLGGFGTSTIGTGGFGTSTPATGSLFGGGTSMFNQSAAPVAPQPSLHAAIDKNPYGNNPLFNASTKPAGSVSSSGPALFAPPEAAEKKQALLPHYKMTPKSASKIKLRGFTPAKPPSDFFSGVSGGSAVVGGSGSSPAGLPKSVLGMLKDDGGDALSGSNYPGAFKPRVKKLVISDDADLAPVSTSTSNGSTPARPASTSNATSANRTVRFLDESESVNIPVVDVTLSTKKATPFANKLASVAPSSPPKGVRSVSPKRSPARDLVYETEPSTQELLELSDAELTRVEGYTVILPTVGKVRFLEPVNLLQASPTGNRAGIAQIPGKIVLLKHKVIEVYPDDTEKDPVGMGVNVPAEVSLDRCWVVDKATGKAITDETDPRFDQHYTKLSKIEGTKMIGFNKSTGTWRFRVEHFSKYGLDDDEDDGDVVAAVPVAEIVAGVAVAGKVPAFSDEFAIEDDEEDEEEDDEGVSLGNDSFAFVKSRKVPAGGAQGKKVADLRKVAALNQMKILQQQQQQQNRRRVVETSILDDLGDEEYEEEEFDVEEQDFVSGEEDVVDEYDEEVNSSFTASVNEGLYSSEVAESVLQKNESVEEENESEELYSVSPNKMARSAPVSRRISNMTAGLFANAPINHSRSVFGASAFGAHNSTSSAVGSLFQPKSSTTQKRGLDSMMDVESLEADPSAGQLGTINVMQEFQSPIKIKKTSVPSVPFSATKKSVPIKSAFLSSKQDEHVVPVPIKEVEQSTPALKVLPPLSDEPKPHYIPVPHLSDSIVSGRQHHCVDAGLFMGRSFRVGWAPGGKYVVSGRSPASDKFSSVSVVVLPEFSWQHEKDSRVKEAFAAAEKNRHQKCLEAILSGSQITPTVATNQTTIAGAHVEPSRIVDTLAQPAKSLSQSKAVVTHSCPIALINKEFNFSTLANISSQANKTISHSSTLSENDTRRPFTQIENSLWNLASALFDPLSLPSPTEDGFSETAIASIKESLQKDRVSNWLRDLSPSNQKLGTSADAIYTHLLNRNISAAVQAAIKNKDLRLATVLAQTGGSGASTRVVDSRSPTTRSTGHGVLSRSSSSQTARTDVADQIKCWVRDGVDSGIPEEYLKVWRLISGDVSLWDKVVLAGATDWRQTFGLYLWYANGGAFSLTQAIREYDLAWSSTSRLSGKPPSPWYAQKSALKDVSYNLLKLHTDSEYSLESALLTSAVGPNLLDHRVSWLLWVVLSRAKHLREFSNHQNLVHIKKNPHGSSVMDHDSLNADDLASYLVSPTADRCTASLCSTLESLGLWKWAVFVAMFLSTQNGRESLVKSILTRWFPVSDSTASIAANPNGIHTQSDDWRFIVSTLRVPPVWVHEAKVLRAQYDSNIHQECVSLIDAEKYISAHQLIVATLCPLPLINESFTEIKKLLQSIPASSVPQHWNLGGGLILEYISTVEQVDALRQAGWVNQKEVLDVYAPKWLDLLRAIAHAKTGSSWISACLASRMSSGQLKAIKTNWSVCLCTLAAKVVNTVIEIEQHFNLKDKRSPLIPGDLLRIIPLSEDTRAKYAGQAVLESWFSQM
ncbi:hypothetical protein BCR33DRAFT_722124 [Rhizoclosmatium globosum]|uniref:Peptidase S59 domain-containing protein n=1 Tax=Rhizoclosmatium globosum TaxID=329046 RepID=A0A1Y2BNI8_9FUNG|nr:hypothetical protein BCR33DRAFT_722124 [Rhizoclosmatium globosum]|eukprot:ORY36323.1 hypothetical protein BCR33DRAFT_722124 [Rhizoclosmatium globosum]